MLPGYSIGAYWCSADRDHTASDNSETGTMSASISHLTELPIEILEQILLHLPGQDIIKMDTVRVTANPTQLCIDFSAT